MSPDASQLSIELMIVTGFLCKHTTIPKIKHSFCKKYKLNLPKCAALCKKETHKVKNIYIIKLLYSIAFLQFFQTRKSKKIFFRVLKESSQLVKLSIVCLTERRNVTGSLISLDTSMPESNDVMIMMNLFTSNYPCLSTRVRPFTIIE